MNAIVKKTLNSLIAFFGNRKRRRILYLALICLIALADFLNSGLVRRSFVFYSITEGDIVTEDRMLNRSSDRETGIRRYVDEVLLGPEKPGSALLFPRETRLASFMYRDAVVFADFSESAALPLPGGRDVFRALLTLNQGIRRNFPWVKDVKLFIGGNEVFFEEFRVFFANSADNSKTAP
jgi:hypothetical protein